MKADLYTQTICVVRDIVGIKADDNFFFLSLNYSLWIFEKECLHSAICGQKFINYFY